MNKKIVLTFCLFYSFVVFCQAPNGYYNNATGSGYALKTQLKSIITSGHQDQGYGALYDAYVTSDTDSFYDNDNTVLDMYSENPNGTDSYYYNHGSRKCGNYNSEDDCYNREHIFPQGFFNEGYPMRSDIHHVVPTDGYVNNRRGSYPFGEINNASYTSNNGSKVGLNTFDNYSGTVFEPIDEFKGDIARMLFYFATRYEDEVTSNSWDSHTKQNNPLNGTNDQVYEDWYIKLLYKWHIQDPVSQREIVRNNEAYNFQGNRNPFIDHPEYVSQIWGSILSSNSNELLKKITIYPNPSNTNSVTVNLPNSIEITSISLYSLIGSRVYNNFSVDESKVKIENLQSGIYLLKINIENKSITKKVIIK